MSSGFVSAGTVEEPVERNEEWLKAQQAIEESRRIKEEANQQEGGKSLYEVLQANKAAKQEAFEESIRLKNQFRALDEDEVDFLDSVLESTRQKEEAIKKETSEQLELFRKHQEEMEKATVEDPNLADTVVEQEQWAASGRKRKRAQDKGGLKGLKLRKSSSSAGEAPQPSKSNAIPSDVEVKSPDKPMPHPSEEVKPKASSPTTLSPATQAKPPPGGLGLGGYSSDEDD